MAETKRSRFRIRPLTVVLLLILTGLAWSVRTDPSLRLRTAAALRYALPSGHVEDEAGLLSKWDAARADVLVRQVRAESGVDMWLLFVRGLEGRTIEEAASLEAERRRIGSSDRDRGLLLLYDADSRAIRLELGYGLEAYFPDAFVGYVLEDHLADFVATNDMRTGVITLVRILQQRLRDGALGGDFDPRPYEAMRRSTFVTGGAGASTSTAGDSVRYLADVERGTQHRFVAQPTIEAAHASYLEWLAAPRYDPDATLFTPRSRSIIARTPLTRAYRAYMLSLEYGKTNRVVERAGLGMMYFTGSPFAGPHFFRRTKEGWQVDLQAEIRNTMEYAGGAWTWGLRRSGDDFHHAFADEMTALPGGPLRFRDGDNRRIPTRDD